MNYSKVCIRISSNINRYRVEISDGTRRGSYNSNFNNTCIEFETYFNQLQVILTPLQSGYRGRLYYTISTKCDSCISANFIRLNDNTPTEPTNRFRLIDANYDLPVGGILTFNSV